MDIKPPPSDKTPDRFGSRCFLISLLFFNYGVAVDADDYRDSKEIMDMKKMAGGAQMYASVAVAIGNVSDPDLIDDILNDVWAIKDSEEQLRRLMQWGAELLKTQSKTH
jgi:hypothetical protein